MSIFSGRSARGGLEGTVTGGAGGPVRDGGAGPAPDGATWRRMHPVTPALRGWKFFVAVLAIGWFQVAQDLEQTLGLFRGHRWVVVVGTLAVVAVIAFAYSAVAWRMTRFAVTDDAVHLQSGILFRQQRRARLDRLQAVDLVQPLLARLVGLAELRLEVAGGAGSAVSLAFLREPEAEALRTELLALAAGLQRPAAPGVPPGTPGTAPSALPGGPAAEVVGGPGSPSGVLPAAASPAGTRADVVIGSQDAAAPVADGSAVPVTPPHGPVPLATVPVAPGPLVAGAPGPVLTPGPAAGPSAFQAAPEQQVYDLPMGRLLVASIRSGAAVGVVVALIAAVVLVVLSRDPGGAFVLVPGLIGAVSVVWGRVNQGAGFRAAISPDGIRLRHGLTEARTQTVPPGRVQAIGLQQGPFWRGRDWWRVEINVAGYGAGTDQGARESVLHPVATRDEAAAALWLVLPDLGTADPRGVIDAALSGRDDEGGFTPAPRRSRWVDPIGFRRHGFLVTDRALVLRSGRVFRRVDVVPHERTQSLGLEQGPLQRRLGLATFVVHSTPGPVSPRVAHLDGAVAAALLDEQARRARQARAVQRPEQWMREQG